MLKVLGGFLFFHIVFNSRQLSDNMNFAKSSNKCFNTNFPGTPFKNHSDVNSCDQRIVALHHVYIFCFSWFSKFSHPKKEQQIPDSIKHLAKASCAKQVICLEAMLARVR